MSYGNDAIGGANSRPANGGNETLVTPTHLNANELALKMEAMGNALSDAAYAHHAIRATLDALQDFIYGNDDGSKNAGMYEAAVASTERLDRALSRGIEAWCA